eukprot:scpid28200/ scgid1081/ Kinesin-like protein KIF26A
MMSKMSMIAAFSNAALDEIAETDADQPGAALDDESEFHDSHQDLHCHLCFPATNGHTLCGDVSKPDSTAVASSHGPIAMDNTGLAQSKPGSSDGNPPSSKRQPPPVAARPAGGKLPAGKSAVERERERERAQRVRQMMKAGVAVRAMAQNMTAAQNGMVVAGQPPQQQPAHHDAAMSTNGAGGVVTMGVANGNTAQHQQQQMHGNTMMYVQSPYSQQPAAQHPQQHTYMMQNLGPITPQQSSQMAANGIMVMSNGVSTAAQPVTQAPVVTSTPTPTTSTRGSLKHSGAGQAFLARAQQLLSGKRRENGEGTTSAAGGQSRYPTCFAAALRDLQPPLPPNLVRGLARRKTPDTAVGKMKVILRITPSHAVHTYLQVDPQRRHVTVTDPSQKFAPQFAGQMQHMSSGLGAEKVFTFDTVLPVDASMTEVCAASVTDLLKAVVQGSDSCIFTYGFSPNSPNGKGQAMVGEHSSSHSMGVVPCALSWLFTLIPLYQQKNR